MGVDFKYKSHVREMKQNTLINFETHFVHDNIQFMNDNGVIRLSSSTDYEENVKVLILSRVECDEKQQMEQNLFQNNALDSIRKKAALMTNPEKHSELLQRKRDYSEGYEEKKKYNSQKERI
jgi:hypothetical protein